jgi:uncharacterized protein (TIGR02246 family)
MHNQQLNRNLIIKNFILFLAVLLILISCGMKQNTPALENIEQTILALERHALDNWAKGDPLAFSDNFADDGTYFDDLAAHMRLDSIEEIQNYFASLDGKISPHSYELVDPKVQIYGDIAILTLRYHSTFPDDVPSLPWKATSVYRLTDGEWHVVHAHWSLVKEK